MKIGLCRIINSFMLKLNFKQTKSITTALWVVVVLFFGVGCSSSEIEKAEAITDRAAIPTLHALDVTTVISDSGITRYRITAPQWDIYDKTPQPYWEFPMGAHFERFDVNLTIEANITCDYAKYFENEKKWELRGNVKATNIKGELFETEQLFWNQNTEKIYSDSTVKITREKYILNTLGFESNQAMTQYTFKQARGVIAAEE